MLLTLATPHTPVVLFDKQTHDFYTRCTERIYIREGNQTAHILMLCFNHDIIFRILASGLTPIGESTEAGACSTSHWPVLVVV